MTLFFEDEYDQLLENGRNFNEASDDKPVVKLFMTNTNCCWLISEINPEYPEIAFGLCDLGMGFPELGFVDLNELRQARGFFRVLCRDENFEGAYPISVYAEAARNAQRIVTDEASLKEAAIKLKIS
ncbi:DUF2958 domain-containing protein [Mucilaginibacter pedocola]|uniref:DUF2958 domain-containing protein n=1 Tax=Mucilaginibacter pedocola TaxID=1792845 RepID=A0A1S9P8S7_9SPHI|nr:DUF2958 domain-containing protein [Mucilaginibacter pedocola]OOQ57373.1 hypothetical protein BC343_14830 [Mucilaginibacter pedocola]